ncbi:hypothetical protein KZO01_16230 [Kurthia zopfii]|uniref:Uncharacterized protein n=1 Tax=Kurthia zopfii TaxID=1650 RepID=A0A8B4Q8S7_9BACL|nr:hypothetical protein [Kurthia zopfii]PWI22804.1 hypothetical protein DF281_05710 [Kurthia zopfii]TDR41844.1 hypothetical protein DFR61_10583 [Kurthia zopfii]GEK31314.1 hypothetical protein KZO01_16230 [Kurthia zopfii]STX09155.1 Uncharacterised protein [Kurthia zopfii]
MVVYHDFLFVDEKNDVLIKEINLEDVFIDFVREDMDCNNDLFNLVPTINPHYVKKPYGNIKPKLKGLDYTGISVINYYGFDNLIHMFSEWINILGQLNVEYYHPDLVDLTEDEIAGLSDYDLKESRKIFFVKSEVMKKMNLCIIYLENSLNSSDIVVYYKGI